MITPIDLEISAKLLIGEHGPEACKEARRRAKELRETGDAQGAATFEQIARSISRFQITSNDNEAL